MKQLSAILASDLPTRRKRCLCFELIAENYCPEQLSIMDTMTKMVDADPSIDEKKKNEIDLEAIKLFEGVVRRYYEGQEHIARQIELHSEIERQLEAEQPPNI